ncbi:type IV secretion system DNA-binding domain-containing protein [Sulfuricurvum sp.]|uniref:type IV secretory system conjugative DNA transfer family protein n=1 Tax=Sulfuricurvum sp. TaxID=2025608 RepID=UPI002622E11A|nr:type IV secretion system DNA-binding domain-containing protein [Sulfuricurvum sp.]MDD4950498.1 type IV secretion system DNA-binding domain-containing protein [Sulfuricurvum sp.]
MTFIEFSRKLRTASIIGGFVGLGLGLAITRMDAPLPFYNLADLMPQTMEGISPWLYEETIKEFLVPNLSVFLTYFLPVWIGALFYLFKYDQKEDEIFKRGSQLLSPKELRKHILKVLKKSHDTHRLTLGIEQIPIPFTQEVKNFLFVGMPGSGKSQSLYSLLLGNVNDKGKQLTGGVVDFNEPLICYERKGDDFVAPLYRRGRDYLFDPRDRDSIKWNIFRDLLTEDGDIDEAMVNFFVNSIAPVSDSKAAHFEEQAQSIVKAVLLAVAGSENPSNKALINFLRMYPTPKALRAALLANPTVILFGADNAVHGSLTVDSQENLDNQATSVYATCNKVFKNLSNRAFYYEGGDFSVREFIASLKDKNVDIRLFVVNTASQSGAYNTYFGLFFTLLYKHILTLPNSKTRRIVMVLDELMSLASGGNKSLGKYLISELINTLAESRSKGLNALIAFQGLSQANEIVGDNLIKSLFQMCGTKIVLQYSEPYGQKLLSQFLGEKEIDRKKQGINRASQAGQDRLNESDEEKIKKIVLESEFANLEPLEAFIKIGNFPASKIKFGYQEPKKICDPLIRKDLPYFQTLIEDQNSQSGFVA